MPALLILTLSPGRAPGQEDEARRILEKALQAHGGAALLARVKAGYTHTTGRLFQVRDGVDFEQRAWFQEPDRVRSEMRVKIGDKETVVVTVVNGLRGWIRVDGQTREMDERALAQAREELYLSGIHHLVALRESDSRLSVVEGVAVGDRATVGLRVTARGHRDVVLYFDKDKGLLLRTDRPTIDRMSGAEYTEAKMFGDFQDADGIRSARSIFVYRLTPTQRLRYLSTEVKEVKFVDRFEDRYFEKP
jgi:hypothetical protein